MSGLAPADVPRLRAETRYRIVGGQAVVVVQDAGEALVLNEVGSRILELVDGERTVEEIAARLEGEFEVETETAAADVEAYLGELAAAGVLEAG